VAKNEIGKIMRQIACLTSILLSACSAILPEGETRVGTGWRDFEHAREAFETIQSYRSGRLDVHTMGLDPFKNTSVAILSYSDILQRFGTGNGLLPDQLERGVRECMEGGRRCSGYQVSVREVKSRRVGNAWLDLFNFKRQTDSDGWSFNGLIVFVDDQVVLTLHGGQPKIHESTIQKNPLGPLQTLPERVGQGIIKP
jgi:hypothetical protein